MGKILGSGGAARPARGARARERCGQTAPLWAFAWACALVAGTEAGAAVAGAREPAQEAQTRPVQTASLHGAPGNIFGPPGGWGNESDLGGSLVRTEGSGIIDEDLVRTAREVISHSTGTPTWTNPKGFEKDVFTFARAIFKARRTTSPIPRFHYGRPIGWWVDFPDADLNLSYRLQQMTSMRVDPDGRVLKLSDPDLHNYPFLFMEHPGYMVLRDSEVAGLRKYLLAGGVLAIIDFWNSTEWAGFAAQMKKVLPEREWTELTIDHPIFNCIFKLPGPMQRLQVPTMQFWNRDHDPANPEAPLQIDRGEGSDRMSVRALHDDKGRLMVIAFHNSDISDGWEREGEHEDYFATFSEKISYPLGVNLIFYLMTH